MQIQADTEVSLFVRDRVTATGFQSKGHQGPCLDHWRNAVTRSMAMSPARRLYPRMDRWMFPLTV